MGPRFVSFAALFYGALTVAAALWGGLRGFDLPFFGYSAAVSVLLGSLAAVLTVTLGLLAYHLLPVLRELADELAPRLLDGAGRSSLVLLALFSGIGEETFFRGALQQEVGLVVASPIEGT